MNRFDVSFTEEDIKRVWKQTAENKEKQRKEIERSLRWITVPVDIFIYSGIAAFGTWFALLCAASV
jgi:hypothetical protein